MIKNPFCEIRGAAIAAATAVILVVLSIAPNRVAAEESRDVRMPFLSAAPEVGLIFFNGVSMKAKENGETAKLNISSRTGIIFKIQGNLFGDGLGLEFNPFVTHTWTGDDKVGKLVAVGAQLGIAYRFHIRSFYPKIGVGGHFAYLDGDIDSGVELYGRFPVGFSYYFMRFLAFDMEVAYMTGSTGIKTKGAGVFDEKIRHDHSHGLEVVLGLRFP